MAAVGGGAVVRFAEGPVTHLRRERKIVLAPDEADAIARRLEAEIGADGPPTRVVAVYLDGPGGELARRAMEAPHDCVKVRAKAYHPDRGPHAGRLVLEVKRERAGVTTKERTWVARAGLRDAVARVLGPIFGPLKPVVAASYSRRIFQASASWRATLDREVAFHPAGEALLDPSGHPWHLALGAPYAIERRAILELKCAAEALPGWLADLAAARGSPYSKFAEAMVHARAARSVGA